MKVSISIIGLFIFSSSLMAQPQNRQGPVHQEGPCGLAALNLTEEQKSEIREIRLEKGKETQALKDELAINKAKINALVHKDNPDMKEIVSLAEENGKIITRIQVREIDSKIKVRAVLDEDQKVIFDAHNGPEYRKGNMAQHRFHQRNQGRNRF